MNIIQVYKQFPTQQDCIKHLEKVRWNGIPQCPYCNSTKQSRLPKESRYHCNNCNISFSVTVNTIFHKTKVDLQKWFLAISLTLNAKKGIAARQLGRDIEVTKDTAWLMMMRIRKSFIESAEFMEGIIEVDETFIGGKNKNRHKNKKIDGSQGGGGKTIVVGSLQRNGQVRAEKVPDRSSETLHAIIKKNVALGAKIMTDDHRSYHGITPEYIHHIVNHSIGQYVSGVCHTNTLEGFWTMLKRGVMGQYHHVSPKYINRYINEFCYRYNARKERVSDVFARVIMSALGVTPKTA